MPRININEQDFTSPGNSLDYANYLMGLTKKKQDVVEEDIIENENGVTTALATFILVGGIGLAFLVMVLLLS